MFEIEKLNLSQSDIPAVTHVDYSTRIQSVHCDTNPRYAAPISAFKATTGCAAIVYINFNVRGEPIVCTPEHVFRCLVGTDMLTVENGLRRKEDQEFSLRMDYARAFEPD